MDPIPPTLATSHHSITQLTFNVQSGKLMPVSPYLSFIRARSAEKVHVCFPSAQLRKEAVGWVEEAEELGARSFGAFIRTGGSRWVELAASLRLGWTAWSHGFLSRDSTEGLYLPCTCPGGNSPDSFSQKPSIRGLIHWGGRSAQHPGGDGGKGIGSLPLMPISDGTSISLFSKGIYFCQILQRPETHTQPLILDLWGMTRHNILLFLRKMRH